ncbi:MAG: DUF4266 domain-containing protein [Proteobacteria bacterium]|nr:DUF4266 domain-containing protein [Pseudomonadota bacterium]
MKRLAVLVTVVVSLGSSACGKFAVRASEKEFLADQVMVFDDDPHETSADDHIRSNREGASGGHGAGGGGCGCN